MFLQAESFAQIAALSTSECNNTWKWPFLEDISLYYFDPLFLKASILSQWPKQLKKIDND